MPFIIPHTNFHYQSCRFY